MGSAPPPLRYSWDRSLQSKVSAGTVSIVGGMPPPEVRVGGDYPHARIASESGWR